MSPRALIAEDDPALRAKVRQALAKKSGEQMQPQTRTFFEKVRELFG